MIVISDSLLTLQASYVLFGIAMPVVVFGTM